ncbi:SGNH/GDSL hydrolase family protein [Geodermatophilus sp. SYSU D00779]
MREGPPPVGRLSAALVLVPVLVLTSACGVDSTGEASSAAPGPAVPSTTAPGTTAPAPTAGPEEPAAFSTFAVVGDSITAGGEVISDARVGGSASWVPAAAEASRLSFVGGWAMPGATTEDARAAVVPEDADVLVVMAGTNDVLQGRPWEESAANLESIAASAGDRVVAVVTIAPSDVVPQARRAYNAALAPLALRHGWVLIDPWSDVEAADRFVVGTTTDGTHLTDRAARTVGFRVGEQLAALV